MEQAKKQVKELIAKIESKIEARQIQFDERSEKGQDSEKGELFEEKTDQLQEAVDNLETVHDNISDFLE
ncbi:hypothetical protein JYU20_00365 [Bacteroidales bacterium AH-315-I05]|nr:hypothetical protein [Bacteroidales bacterium AH-315-I05]